MSKRLIPLILAFGLIDGLCFFLKRIIKKAGRNRSSRYQTDIYIRDKFADKYTFKQVFLEDQYNLNSLSPLPQCSMVAPILVLPPYTLHTVFQMQKLLSLSLAMRITE
jgi:hypothetical protein